MKVGKTRAVTLVCPVCGSESFIQRRMCHLKENGHVKHLWCFSCQEVTPHVERRES